MFICTIKKVETLYAQTMITSYLHRNTLNFERHYIHCILKTKVLEKLAQK